MSGFREEIMMVIKISKNDKSPSVDGLLVEFYANNIDQISEDLL